MSDTASKDQQYTLEPLTQSVDKKFHAYTISDKDKVEPQLSLRPTFKAGYKIIGNPELKERRMQALKFAAEGLNRPELPALFIPYRDTLNTQFTDEVQLLDDLMLKIKVEHFLQRLSTGHDFITGKPVGNDKYISKTPKDKAKSGKKEEAEESISAAIRNACKQQFARQSTNTDSGGNSSQTKLPRPSQHISDLWVGSEEENYASAEEDQNSNLP
ncbi:hypothetical protein VKT23_014660 [Stygiomarasmius scandens]|uniref:Uncharacterized protein n=1 Tax=Marasmiellus scandens TaxID=2682957 RepID=A0ABR1J066_9AGAR